MNADIDLLLLNPILERYQDQKDALITMLQEVQEAYGYLPEAALTRLSKETRVPLSQIFAVATFYAQFHTTPRGLNIVKVCRGTACHVQGGKTILRLVKQYLGIEEGETTADREYTLETVACIGACALAPNIVINGVTHSHMNAQKLSRLLSRRGEV
jgi:NADH-quinone oxidoreductase subunit E